MKDCCRIVELHQNHDYIITSNDTNCDLAIFYGHLDCLKYFHQNGFQWTSKTFEYATYCGNVECIQYLHNTKEFTHKKVKCYDTNQIHNHTTTNISYMYMEKRVNGYQFLIEHGYAYDDYFKTMFQFDEWFQRLNSFQEYMKSGTIDKYTLHIHHKVLRIQREWQKYSHNPTTTIGFKKMKKTINELYSILS